MAGSFDDTDDGLDGKKAVLRKTDILGAGWESRLEEARARRAKALEGKEQPEAAEAPKPWEAASAAALPPLIDEATGEAADAPDLSLLGLSADAEPGLPDAPSQDEIDAAIAAARSARIDERADDAGEGATVVAPVPVAPVSVVPVPVAPVPDAPRSTDRPAVVPVTTVPLIDEVDTPEPEAVPSWEERQRMVEEENQLAAAAMLPETTEEDEDDTVVVGGVRWGLVAAAALVFAAPIAAYGLYNSDERVGIMLRTSLGSSDPAPLALQPTVLERVRMASLDPTVVSDAAAVAVPGSVWDSVDTPKTPIGPLEPSLKVLKVGLVPANPAPYVAAARMAAEEIELWTKMAGLDPLNSDVRLAFGFNRTAEPEVLLSDIAPRVASNVARLSVVATLGIPAPPLRPGPLERRPTVSVDTALAGKGPAPLDLLPVVPERLGRGPYASPDWMAAVGDAVRYAAVALPETLDLYLPIPPDRGLSVPRFEGWDQALAVPDRENPGLPLFTTGEIVTVFDTEPARRDPFQSFDRAMVLAMLAPAPSFLPPPAPTEQIVPVLSGPRVTPLPDADTFAAPEPDVVEGAVVYVHAATTAEAAEIEAAMTSVKGATGFATQTTPPFDFKISQTQVRYFHEADREAAAAVADAMSARLRSFLNFDPKPEPGTVELWLAGGGKSGAGAAAPKVATKKPAAPKRTATKKASPPRQVQRTPTRKIEATTIIRKRLSTIQKILGGSGG